MPTLRDLEAKTERTVSATTLSKLDIGLNWEPGSAAEVLDGGKPRALRVEAIGRAASGPDVVSVGIPVLIELLSVSQSLEAVSTDRRDIPELEQLSDRLAAALHPVYGEYVTGLFEANKREHGSLSPIFAVFGHLLDEPNDSDDSMEREERAYRRWLAGRDQELSDDTRSRFEQRFEGDAQ
ncbi:hypothetical protein E5720_17610 [Rhodococcus sp. PAMC28707]|uniref:hypothetical protein n=1 Tax=unclassified Rhodococcus (in: high G+C Gram-positive bacteria) TaxID=192944 RepID=UPI00109DA883|nr:MULTISPECIES: hypothetical protein [unclassified Rhodococcus (in: high G+C Gram-positive bacteria)]QCB51798.1 hypothetical protein E5769_17915 [Rhodococcus sp. PAMC28705]QCB60034.1 hypothetical protein E5720_17610 [Rhodococcus sp. PAMC28707]